MNESLRITATHRRVRVWFGAQVIADHTAVADQAALYEAAMRRRFASLRVTSEPVAGPALPVGRAAAGQAAAGPVTAGAALGTEPGNSRP